MKRSNPFEVKSMEFLNGGNDTVEQTLRLEETNDDMMNCFCGMVDRRKPFSLISSRDHCQRSLTS